MFLKRLADKLAVSIVVFYRFDLADSAQIFEGLIVQLIDMGHVWVGDDDIRQGLHITEAVS